MVDPEVLVRFRTYEEFCSFCSLDRFSFEEEENEVQVSARYSATLMASVKAVDRPYTNSGGTSSLKIPKPMKIEHEELHSELRKATREKGPLGDAAKAVAEVLHPHFVKEEEFAMPPLGLLAVLAGGRASAKMKDALVMTSRLRADLDQMLKEHKQIVVALKKLVVEAKREKKLEYVEFADKLVLHAQTEEEVYYPASILIGKYLKLKLKK